MLNNIILLFKNEININYYENIHFKKLRHEKKIDISENKENPIVCAIKERLVNKKCEIDSLNPKKMGIIKKMLNPYEFIYTSSKKNKNICSIIPISRSYFKLHEIVKDLDLLKDNIFLCLYRLKDLVVSYIF